MNVEAQREAFILHWGELGARWGISRTVAQIHALLFLADAPLHAQEIAETLGVARSNVSTSLKELQNWGLVRIVHQRNDRREYFEALSDGWEMMRRIAEERKKRELDPTIALLERLVAELAAVPKQEAEESRRLVARLKDLLEVLRGLDRAFQRIAPLSPAVVRRLLSFDKSVEKLLRSL